MANYFKIVNLDDKEVHGLGTKASAKYLLPMMAKELSGKTLCFYGDESYSWGEDKYETWYNNEDFGEPWGPEYFDKGEPTEMIEKYGNDFAITEEQLESVMKKLEGKELPNLYEEIQRVLSESKKG